MKAHRAFARTSPKISGRLLGTPRRSQEEDYETRHWRFWRLPDYGSKVISLVVIGSTVTAQDFKRLSVAEPPVPKNLGIFDG
ncbi:hypothetical protein B296_00039482 [Ensete ventricosum]|uniref:Uncharacterized protein n=1 Tax=Ensete ventricosum TaxID=4639 RepID=A0A426XYT3_ENSVE|nr:hypothetical protein B296_00039482 [Ensete ventricosum]